MQLSTAEVTMPGAVTHTVYQQGSDRIDPKGYTRRGFERKQPRPYSETHSARRIHSPRNHGGSLGRQS